MSKRKVKCKYGRLKRKIGRRICRQSGTTSKKRGRHSRGKAKRRAAAGVGGLLVLAGIGAGAYYLVQNGSTVPAQ